MQEERILSPRSESLQLISRAKEEEVRRNLEVEARNSLENATDIANKKLMEERKARAVENADYQIEKEKYKKKLNEKKKKIEALEEKNKEADKMLDQQNNQEAVEKQQYSAPGQTLDAVGSVAQMAVQQMKRLVPGKYIMKNLGNKEGMLTYTRKETRRGGHYGQVLTKGRYFKKSYQCNGVHRKAIEWEIAEAEDGFYTITNLGTGGMLTYTDNENPSYSGFYIQILEKGGKEAELYNKPAIYRNRALWEIFEENNAWVIKNRALIDGFLAFSGAELSPCGQYAQVLVERKGSYYNIDKNKYNKNMVYSKNKLWNCEQIKESENNIKKKKVKKTCTSSTSRGKKRK